MYDGRDDSRPMLDMVMALPEEEQKRWRNEALYFETLVPTLPPSDNAVEAARPYLIEKFG